jgi:hypothetical protein
MSASRKIWPSVIEIRFVGMYAEMSPPLVSPIGIAVLVGHPGRSLQKARVQVEDVPREGLASRRAPQ